MSAHRRLESLSVVRGRDADQVAEQPREVALRRESEWASLISGALSTNVPSRSKAMAEIAAGAEIDMPEGAGDQRLEGIPADNPEAHLPSVATGRVTRFLPACCASW